TDAVTTDPARASLTHFGAVPGVSTLAVSPPAAARYWNERPFPADTIIAAFLAPAVTPSRIITPAFVHGCTSCTVATRATMAPSPLSDWCTKWNASAVLQISAPDAVTRKVPLAYVAVPAGETLPMSCAIQGAGGSAAVETPVPRIAIENAPFDAL